MNAPYFNHPLFQSSEHLQSFFSKLLTYDQLRYAGKNNITENNKVVNTVSTIHEILISICIGL